VDLERLSSFFAGSPAARLLRSPQAAYVVYFLNKHFKTGGAITIPHAMLCQKVCEFQETIHVTAPGVLVERPESYVTKWSTGETRWLRRFHDVEHSEPVYELTPHTEDVLKFLTEVLERNLGFVGTESRLKRIIGTLSDIVVRDSANPARRLEHLRAERERIDDEIAAIESGKAVETYSPTAVRERFSDAASDLGSLQGDFRSVEDAFRNITRAVQKRQSETDGTRGEILGFALDEEGSLKSQDQGISFDAFVRLLLSPRKQDELEAIVRQLNEIEILADQIDGLRKIRGMMGSLSVEAEKLLRTTRRLSSTLRRLLDTRSRAGRARLGTVLRDIRGMAARLAERPEVEVSGVDIYTQLDLLNVNERSFWSAPSRFAESELRTDEPDEDDCRAAFKGQAAMQRLDWTGMRARVGELLEEDQESLTLPELLEIFPPDAGVVEVLGYVQIAHDDGHDVDEMLIDVIELPKRQVRPRDDEFDVSEFWGSDITHGENDEVEPETWEVPRVTFLSEQRRALRDRLPLGESSR
jgi:hypothetical protein